jgi:hypothetical protein
MQMDEGFGTAQEMSSDEIGATTTDSEEA